MILQKTSSGCCFCDGVQITDDRYAEIAAALAAKPDAPAGYEYRLTEALVWELYDLPSDDAPVIYTEAELAELTNAELEQILYRYGITASMTKANMIRLILAEQEATSDE